MSDEYKPLTREELNEMAGEELPERAAMSLINANVAAPDQRGRGAQRRVRRLGRDRERRADGRHRPVQPVGEP